MKKRIIALSASVIMLFAMLYACDSQENESVNESVTEELKQSTESQPIYEITESENIESITDSVISEFSEYCEYESELYETNIEVTDGYGTYVIDEANGNGLYISTFTAKSNEIVFADGRIIPLEYSEFVYDEISKTYQAVINGRNYRLSEYTDYEGVLCQWLECIDSIEGFPETTNVLYYPELEYGNITMGFVFEKGENNEFKFTYPDGYSETKTMLYSEELEMYYFE